MKSFAMHLRDDNVISHELRTPLVSIQSNAELLSREDLTLEQQEKVSDILVASERLLKFVNHLTLPPGFYSQQQEEVGRGGHVELSELKKNSSLSVLLVEDEPLVQKVHTAMLREINCSVDLAKDGYETLDKLSNAYDVVLMDIGLPEISGIEIIRSIRRFKNHNKYIPIIVLTAYTEQVTRDTCLEAGANEVLHKPVSLAELERALCHIVG